MLKARQINFRYHHLRPLLEDVNLTLEGGSLCHVTGGNGAGKSTLLKILAGLQQPNAGAIDVTLNKGQMTYLPAEHNGHYLKLTGQENLRFWLNMQGVPVGPASIDEALNHWGLHIPKFLGAFPVERFSTGMKRRLALCRLALSRARLWLLDEPLLGLDTQGVDLFKGILGEHLKAGGACAIISHDGIPLRSLVTETLELSPMRRGGPI